MQNKVNVLFARQDTYDLEQVQKHLNEMFENLGGLERFVSRGDKVLLKPNLVLKSSRDKCALTDPCVIEAVVRILQDNSVDVSLGDSPAFGSAISIAKSNGMQEVCERYGVKIISFSKNKKSINEDNTFSWSISQTLKDFDKIINLPKLKGHQQLYYTGAVKNLFGCVAGKKKFFHHMIEGNSEFRFGKMLIEIAELVSPVISIMDGIWAMAGNGPLNGEPKNIGLLGISESPLLLDLAICKELGADFEQLDIYQASGKIKLSEISVNWMTEKACLDSFYFPINRAPIRFSLKHAIKSTLKSLKP